MTDEDEGTLRLFFDYADAGYYPYPVTFTMLDAIAPVLDTLPPQQINKLAELAISSGYEVWARALLWDRLGHDIRQRIWPEYDAVVAALNEAESAVYGGPGQLYTSYEFQRLLSMPRSRLDLVYIVSERLQEVTTGERFVIAAVVMDVMGEASDIAWWEEAEPEDGPLHPLWSAVRFTLLRRRWHS